MRTLLALAILLVIAAPARAGTYEHHTLSPASPGLDGWAPETESVSGFVAAGVGPDRLWTRFWARPWFEPGELAEWVYTAAADTSIAGWEVQRAVTGVAGGDWNTLFGLIVDGRWHHAAWDVPSIERAWGPIGGSGPAAGRLVARLACGGPHVCPGAAAMELRGVRMVLHDAHAPAVSGAQGELVSERALAGTAALSFAATDRGGGVYRAWAEVDGRPSVPVAIGDARCRDAIEGGDPYQFAHRRPCPLEAGATVAVDTTALSDGRHVVAVHVEDAAGNRTTVFGPAARTVDNEPAAPPPPAASSPALPSAHVVTAWLERRGRRTGALTVPHGERVRVRGRVTDAAGHPLAAAPVDIAEQVMDGRASWHPITGARTRGDGRFTAFARVGPSRRLRIGSSGSLAPRLTVRVRAPITVTVSPRGRGVAVRGRVHGGRIPRGGALVELQARSGRRWTTRLVVRTWRSGRFSGRMERGPAVRVRVPRQAGLPYEAGLARAAISPRRRGGRTGPRTSR